MPKEIPDCPSKPTLVLDAGHGYDIELITPMFGGGVETRVNDPSFPVRPTAIRGQLQFWWRATVGAQYTTRQELRAAQSAIWGSTERASRVQVLVENVRVGTPEPCARFEQDNKNPGKYRSVPAWNQPFNNTSLSYALFPFQGQLADGRKRIEVEPTACIHKASFRLTLRCHKDIDFAKDVEPAMWAWVNFGGVGSRTRRGCGALFCKALAPKDADDLAAKWKKYVSKAHPIREWPTMPSQFLYHPTTGKPLDQWNRVIGLLRDFRQKAGAIPGHPRPLGPDRSWYPEPDTIRRITGDFSSGHDPSAHLSGGNPLPDGFPRAEFGLPIVFKFIDDKNGDPQRTTLHPYVGGTAEDRGTPGSPDIHITGGEIKDRMASPLVLKPLALATGGALAVILPIHTRGVDHVALVDGSGNDRTPRHTVPVRDATLVGYPDSPIGGLSTTDSALTAFLNLAVLSAGTHGVHADTGYRRIP